MRSGPPLPQGEGEERACPGMMKKDVDGQHIKREDCASRFLPGHDEETGCPLTHLANHGKIPLELIEVQTGSYLGEDDIVRLDDIYKRS